MTRFISDAAGQAMRILKSRAVSTTLLVTLMLVVLVLAVMMLAHILRDTSWSEILLSIEEIGVYSLLACVGLTVANYFVLTGYDVLSLRVIGRKVAYARTALASFTSYIFSHNLGFSALTGGVARLRIYRLAGLSFGEVAQIIVLAGTTYWLGVFLLLGLGLMAQPSGSITEFLQIAPWLDNVLGGFILSGLALYMILLQFRAGRPVRLFRWSLILPNKRIALLQFALAALDICLATAALYVLLPGVSPAEFPQILFGYIVAFVAGMITHTPGGIGVFEVIILLALPHLDPASLFGALLVYRFLYYLIPFAIGVVLFALHEAIQLKRDGEESEATA